MLLSDILGVLSFTFKNKAQEIKYLKLHNFIFKDLIISHLYRANFNKWLDFLNKFTSWTIDTPQPILKLYITADLETKQFIIKPSMNRAKEMLVKPLKHL